jgi:hypothetical protein
VPLTRVVVSTHLNQKSPDLARNFTIKNSELRLLTKKYGSNVIRRLMSVARY